jgi:hypothetical protein
LGATILTYAAASGYLRKFQGISQQQSQKFKKKLVRKCKANVCECFYILVFLLTTGKINHVIPQLIKCLIQNHIRLDCFAGKVRLLSTVIYIYRYWNHLINSFREVWIHMAKRVGAKILAEPYVPIHKYKNLFIHSTYLVQQMKNRSAFEVMTLEGHMGRVMALTQGRDLVATGMCKHHFHFA